ncbi:MAG: SAM-dependent chlorinase/fluorinase [Acidobacteria bacterium]|nr:SAM-dependent chlorinase/fluorinase [Acidobacteriota bacterium]
MKKLILISLSILFSLLILNPISSLTYNVSAYQAQVKSQVPTVLFMTDFGENDDSVAICKGVMLQIEPRLRIIDISHQVTPYSILDGARFLAGASRYYPSGTVFVTVIDPGVGSTRKAIVAKSKRGQYFVLPNNGLITLVEAQDGLEEIREITNTKLMIGQTLSSTFHGRDIFAPIAAHLAHGTNWTRVGARIALSELVKLNINIVKIDEKGLTAEVIALDGQYGNLITNIDEQDFAKLGYKLGDKVTIKIADHEISMPFVKTFSDVAINTPLLYVDSRGHLAMAINQNNFAQNYKIQIPSRISIEYKTK